MDVTRKTKISLRLQRYSFTILFLAAIGLLAWLSTQYAYEADWTASSRNSLTADSVRLLALLNEPAQITAFARENAALRGQIKELIARYQRHKPDIALNFVNPDAEPERVRELGVTMDGELRVAYQGRSERVQELSEQSLTNAMLRVAKQGERWIAFLSGHGERDPHGQANHDLGSFGSALGQKGLKVQSINLTQAPTIPDNISLLVIASPQVALLADEVELIRSYLDKGGNLLWLTEPKESVGLEKLAEYLGIETLPGTIVDANTKISFQYPDFAPVTEYPSHPVTRELRTMSLFPHTAALEWQQRESWEGQPLLSTLERAWTETGELSGEIRYDTGGDERAGPLDIGFVLTRARTGGMANPDGDSATNSDDASQQQRIIVVGDGDFLSNTYLGNVGNLNLGLNMVDWLSNDDSFISINAKSAQDLTLNLSNIARISIFFGFLLVLPLLLLGSGVFIWLRRRKR